MTFAGLLGVPAGSYVSQKIRHRVPNADPIVSGSSLVASVPILYVGFIVARYSTDWCYLLTFIAGKSQTGPQFQEECQCFTFLQDCC